MALRRVRGPSAPLRRANRAMGRRRVRALTDRRSSFSGEDAPTDGARGAPTLEAARRDEVRGLAPEGIDALDAER